MDWVSFAIPKELVERIEKIRPTLGYPTISAFLQEAIRRHLNSKEREYDGIQEEREVGRKVLGRD
jgi:Arc/MetJ-type ribon-helix-helix transcriptional regulator